MPRNPQFYPGLFHLLVNGSSVKLPQMSETQPKEKLMMNFMKNNGPVLTGVCVAMLLLSPVAASAAVSKGDVLGTNEQDIRAALEQRGYTVQEIELEDGVIEAEFIAQGTEMEIEVDKVTGQVLEVEND